MDALDMSTLRRPRAWRPITVIGNPLLWRGSPPPCGGARQPPSLWITCWYRFVDKNWSLTKLLGGYRYQDTCWRSRLGCHLSHFGRFLAKRGGSGQNWRSVPWLDMFLTPIGRMIQTLQIKLENFLADFVNVPPNKTANTQAQQHLRNRARYSWIGHGLQSVPTLAFCCGCQNSKPRPVLNFSLKNSGVVIFYFFEKSKKWARTAKNDVFGNFSKNSIVFQ